MGGDDGDADGGIDGDGVHGDEVLVDGGGRGGDDPDVVEGAPGGLLPGHRLVPPRAVANTDLRQEMQTNERQNCGFRAALFRGLLGVLKCEDCSKGSMNIEH